MFRTCSLSSLPCLFLAVLVPALLNAGCGSSGPPPPKTYGVSGKVVFTDGKPMTGGMVEFRSTTESLAATGEIKSDGSFSLITLTEHNAKVEGAVAGQHEVTIMPPMGKDQNARPIPLGTYTVEAKDGQSFTLTVERPEQQK